MCNQVVQEGLENVLAIQKYGRELAKKQQGEFKSSQIFFTL